MEHSEAHPHHFPHPASKPASNWHVFLSFGLSAVITIVGFSATWGRAEQWREDVGTRIEKMEQEQKATEIVVAQHEATIRVVEAQYTHIGKQLDRVEELVREQNRAVARPN